jgi:hypothetical protein
VDAAVVVASEGLATLMHTPVVEFAQQDGISQVSGAAGRPLRRALNSPHFELMFDNIVGVRPHVNGNSGSGGNVAGDPR